jgi:hypothetical protein
MQLSLYRFLKIFSSETTWPNELEKILKNRPIRNKNCLWWPCLLMDRDKMSNLYKGPSIDASYQVSVHLAEEFQRRRLSSIKNDHSVPIRLQTWPPQVILVSDWLIF